MTLSLFENRPAGAILRFIAIVALGLTVGFVGTTFAMVYLARHHSTTQPVQQPVRPPPPQSQISISPGSITSPEQHASPITLGTLAGQLNPETATKIINDYYAAIKNGDCDQAIKIRQAYTDKRCKNARGLEYDLKFVEMWAGFAIFGVKVTCKLPCNSFNGFAVVDQNRKIPEFFEPNPNLDKYKAFLKSKSSQPPKQ